MSYIGVRAIEWEAVVPGYRGVIQWRPEWEDCGDVYPETWSAMVWDLRRSDVTDHSDQIYPPGGVGYGFKTFRAAVDWLLPKLAELAAGASPATTGPVNVDANGAPV